MSALRRELKPDLGKPVAEFTRADIVGEIERMRTTADRVRPSGCARR